MLLEDDDGLKVDNQVGFCGIAEKYFDKLFRALILSCMGVLRYVDSKIDMVDNEALTKSFVLEEFKYALFQMHLDKASGPDRLSPTLYKRFWNVCGFEIF